MDSAAKIPYFNVRVQIINQTFHSGISLFPAHPIPFYINDAICKSKNKLAVLAGLSAAIATL